jgi:hypothetical protein
VTPEAIAVAVNRLDRRSIDRFKRNALVAARELNWQSEGRKLVDACAASLRGGVVNVPGGKAERLAASEGPG